MGEVSPLLQALYEGKDDEVAARLAKAPDLDLFEAAASGRTERLRELLDANAELAQARSPDGFTALHLAAFFAHPEAARLLLERGADPDAVAENRMCVTPLHSAAAARNVETARDLLDRGADPNARQEGGFVALDAALQNRDDELRALLLARGADPDAVTMKR